MLHFYDKTRSVSLLAFAAASGLALSGTANAEMKCADIATGTPGLVGYVSAASSCVENSDVLADGTEAALASHINQVRYDLELPALERRAGLDMAAQAHALDMVERDYVAHTDPEGRDHLYRVRAFERTGLIGNFGAVVMAASADRSAVQLAADMSQDPQNASNLIDDSFTDFGIGVAVHEGRQLVVLVFADIEGDLQVSLPVAPSTGHSLAANFDEVELRPVTWRLVEADTGASIRRSFIAELDPLRLPAQTETALIIEAKAGASEVSLKGPLVTRD